MGAGHPWGGFTDWNVCTMESVHQMDLFGVSLTVEGKFNMLSACQILPIWDLNENGNAAEGSYWPFHVHAPESIWVYIAKALGGNPI